MTRRPVFLIVLLLLAQPQALADAEEEFGHNQQIAALYLPQMTQQPPAVLIGRAKIKRLSTLRLTQLSERLKQCLQVFADTENRQAARGPYDSHTTNTATADARWAATCEGTTGELSDNVWHRLFELSEAGDPLAAWALGSATIPGWADIVLSNTQESYDKQAFRGPYYQSQRLFQLENSFLKGNLAAAEHLVSEHRRYPTTEEDGIAAISYLMAMYRVSGIDDYRARIQVIVSNHSLTDNDIESAAYRAGPMIRRLRGLERLYIPMHHIRGTSWGPRTP